MDKAVIGHMRIGYFRIGVTCDDWDTLLKTFERIGSCDVTRRRLMLMSPPDAITGWYSKSFEESTIEMPIVERGSSYSPLLAGTYVRTDALGRTADSVEEGDEIISSTRKYFEVKSVREIYSVGGDSFSYRDCDLTVLPLHSLTYSDVTPTVEDARYRTKDYWETYIDGSNLNNHSFIVCYADPDYPLVKVFKTKGVHIIFAVAQPNSAPLLGHDRAAYGYEESVPTHVLTLDTQLQWLAEAELRRICEEHPSGSQRSLERRASHDRWLGSARLYDTEYILNYRRDLT